MEVEVAVVAAMTVLHAAVVVPWINIPTTIATVTVVAEVGVTEAVHVALFRPIVVGGLVVALAVHRVETTIPLMTLMVAVVAVPTEILVIVVVEETVAMAVADLSCYHEQKKKKGKIKYQFSN
jgi:hypothetical protein